MQHGGGPARQPITLTSKAMFTRIIVELARCPSSDAFDRGVCMHAGALTSMRMNFQP